jgi:hypothetical protein
VRLKAVKLFIFVILGVWLSSAGFRVWAEGEAPQKAEKAVKSGDKKKTNIDFEDELVEGELKKPELFYLLQKKQFNFKRLIKLREDFLPEMRRDADEIRRGRSKN